MKVALYLRMFHVDELGEMLLSTTQKKALLSESEIFFSLGKKRFLLSSEIFFSQDQFDPLL